MRSLFSSAVCLASLLASFAGPIDAQDSIGGRISVEEYIHALAIPAVAGSPFTAIEELENSQVLQDGTHIRKRTVLHVGRDIQGRTHQEERYFLRAVDNGEARIRTIVLYDPPAKTKTVLDPGRQIAYILTPFTQPTRPAGNNTYGRQEDLGVATLEGQVAEGKRYTRTLSAGGAAANDRPLAVSDEIWYSPELQVDVFMKQVDPRHGEVTMKLTQISRREPATELFQIPGSYRIVNTPAPPN